MAMEHKPIKSSNIQSVAFDDATKTLEVRFKGNSGTYSYNGVPREVYDRMTSGGESAGKLLATAVKGKFPYTKV